MTKAELAQALGIRGIRKISDHTTVVEYDDGARPATELEQAMWTLLTLPTKHEVRSIDSVTEGE